MTPAKKNITATAICLCALTQSCFTGVESTPRIKNRDVVRSGAATVTSEAIYLADAVSDPPAKWQSGKPFLVTNNRIEIIFNPTDAAQNLKGKTITYRGNTPAVTLLGETATDLIFTQTGSENTLVYRVAGVDAASLDTISHLDVPFTVDLDLVAHIDTMLRGKRLYIRTPQWYKPASRERTHGLRHVAVTVDSVAPGNENFPAAVFFSLADPHQRTAICPDGSNRFVYMSTGTSRAATRNFDTLFSFTDPRTRYTEIKDDIWQLIIASKVRKGMSRDECRLALGAPPVVERIPTTAGMAERWRYSDGVFLLFEDGYLTRYRL